MRVEQVKIIDGYQYGNGCSKYPNCFLCPEDGDCEAQPKFGIFVHKDDLKAYRETGEKVWEKRRSVKVG